MSPIGDETEAAMLNDPIARRGVLIGAACAGLTTGACDTRAPQAGEAYAPWRLWDDPANRGTPRALVAAAILAANPHDTQPWLFRLAEDRIDVFADLSRNLGAMDANVRELHLGLGCAIQNALLAAGPNGYGVELEVKPGSLSTLAERRAPVLAATLHLSRRAPTAPDALYLAMPRRHTNRFAYHRDRPVPQAWRDRALAVAAGEGVRLFLFDDGPDRRRFDSAVLAATEAIIADAPMIGDSDRWLRATRAEIEAHRDGPTLEAAGLSPLKLALARTFPVSPGASHAAWLGQTREVQLASAPLVGLIAVRDRYDRPGAVAAGGAWQRLHLDAAMRGIALQPLNQPIEMVDREHQRGGGQAWRARVAALTGPDWQATFAFRAGLPTVAAPPSPRRALESVIAG
jgi:nitroreductase